MNDTNIDTLSKFIKLENFKRVCALTILSAGVDANIFIFIVIILGVNGALGLGQLGNILSF